MTDIHLLVEKLPEIYQPIYGHPELAQKASRESLDRLATIGRVYDALERLLGRSLKVLDLGCAQGFFCFKLAERGAHTHGVDYLPQNIDICAAIAADNPSLSVSFELERAEEVISKLEIDQYDLILGLSIFHHIIHEKGISEVAKLLNHVCKSSGAIIVELALREEPLFWGKSQPIDPRILLDGAAFVHEVGRHSTHLAEVPRPMYVASNHFWILESYAGKFNSWTFDPHTEAKGIHQKSRRYFFSKDNIIKLFDLKHSYGARNLKEIQAEADFLSNPPEHFPAPICLTWGVNDAEAWLVVERKSGQLLLDLLRENAKIDPLKVLQSILNQLIILENAGLYHDDVRTWNILIQDNDLPLLIDYGSISNQPGDCAWPYNQFLAFFIFVYELATGVVDLPDPLRTVAISPYSLPQPYKAWAMSLWEYPLPNWSFRLMLTTLDSVIKEGDYISIEQAEKVWMQAIESALQSQKIFTQSLKQHVEAIDKALQDTLQQKHRLEVALQDSYHQNQRFEAILQENQQQLQKSELMFNSLMHSHSMRLTAPLRFAGFLLRNIRDWAKSIIKS